MRFATDSTLGKLGRYLRAAGFDTVCQHQCRQRDFFYTIDPARIILTRTGTVRQQFKERRLIFIRDNDPLQQLRQVVNDLCIHRAAIKPFSRCLQCNREVNPIDKMAVMDQVPAFVWQCHQTFHKCAQCGQIYWAGSHHDRMERRLTAIFFNQGNENA